MSDKTRLPDDLTDTNSMRPFLDAIDRRQLRLGQLEDLSDSATDADIIAKINAMLATQRTR